MVRRQNIGRGETREAYVHAAARYARRRFDYHCDAFPRRHESFAVADALADAERAYVDLGTYGVEGDCEGNGEGRLDIQYLNAGEAYVLTVVYWRGLFRAACWGDIVESAGR